MKVRSISHILSIIFVLLLASATTAYAQTTRNMTIIPPSIEQSVNPGDKLEGTLKLINDTDTPLTFSVDVRDYIVQDTVGTPSILPPNTLSNRFSAASWLGVVPNQLTVASHEKAELTYYLQVPKNAAPGGHYLAVLYTPVGDSANGTGAAVNTELGTLFKISVAGPITEYALITNLTAPSFQENGPVRIDAQIQNNGDLHIKPEGKIVIRDMFGRVIQEIALPEYNIFPTAARDYEVLSGGYWMAGRFEAEVLASYGVKGNLPLSAKVVFYVFPWKVTIIIVLAIIAAILLVALYRRNKKKKEIDPSEDNVVKE